MKKRMLENALQLIDTMKSQRGRWSDYSIVRLCEIIYYVDLSMEFRRPTKGIRSLKEALDNIVNSRESNIELYRLILDIYKNNGKSLCSFAGAYRPIRL